MGWELLDRFFQREGSESKSRSTVLSTLVYFEVAILAAITATAATHSPEWLLVWLCGLFSLGFIAILAAYAFFAVTKPDYLRSEWHSIRTLEIERGISGDSDTGTLEPQQINATVTVPLQIGESK